MMMAAVIWEAKQWGTCTAARTRCDSKGDAGRTNRGRTGARKPAGAVCASPRSGGRSEAVNFKSKQKAKTKAPKYVPHCGKRCCIFFAVSAEVPTFLCSNEGGVKLNHFKPST
jgi:hypothetical protein